MTGSPIVNAFLLSAALPAVLFSVGVLTVGQMKEPWRARLQSLFFALAFSLGAYLLVGRLGFPPHDGSEALTWCALILAFFVWIQPQSIGGRYALRAVFVAIVGAVLLWPIRESSFAPINYRNLIAFFCLGVGVWSIIERSSGRVQKASALALPLVVATFLSFFVLLKGSASYSQLVTIVCALLGAGLTLSVLFGSRVSLVAFVPFLSAFLVVFMAAALFYLGVNPWHLIFLCWPFAVLWVRESLTFLPKHKIIEPLVLIAVAVPPLAYFSWNVFQVSGPLY